MRVAWILLLVGTVGCEGGAADASAEPVLGDGVWFELEPAAPGQPDGPGHYTLSCDPNAYVVQESLSATGGAGRIDVHHTGVWAACSTDWEISGVVREDVVEMTYTQWNEVEDDCSCQGELVYTILNVSSGDWTVLAAGLEAEVSVSAP